MNKNTRTIAVIALLGVVAIVVAAILAQGRERAMLPVSESAATTVTTASPDAMPASSMAAALPGSATAKPGSPPM